MARQGYHYGNLKETAIQKALELQEKREIEIVSVREVARELGVNHGALNRHFGNRASFIQNLATPVYSLLIKELKGRISKRKSARKKLVELAVGFQRFAYRKPGLVNLLLDPDIIGTTDQALLSEYWTLLGILEGVVAEGQNQREFVKSNPADLAYVVLTFSLGYWQNTHAQRGFEGSVPTSADQWSTVESHFRKMFALVLDGIMRK